MTKKSFGALLFLVMAMLFISCTVVWAEETSCSCGDYAAWVLSDEGVLTLSGKGSISDGGWDKTAVKNLVIEEGITFIDYEAFAYCSNLKTVSFPSTLEQIFSSAFLDCTSLVTADFSNASGLLSIGWYAFNGCSSLEVLDLLGASKLEAIYYEAFGNCSGLTYIYFPSSLTTMETPFENCTSLVFISVEEGGYLYSENGVLYEKYTDYDTLREVVYIVIYPAKNPMTEYEVPEGVISLEGTFADNPYLKSVTLPSSLMLLNSGTFYNCTGLESVTLSEGVEYIGNGAFRGCVSLKSIYIPSTVDYIGSSAFENCTSLSEVTVSNGVRELQYEAFAGCTALTSIAIPTSVSTIEYGVFNECINLAEITVDLENEYFCISEGVLMNIDKTAILFYPVGLTSESYEISADITDVYVSAFSFNTYLKEITAAGENTNYKSVDGVLFSCDGTQLYRYPAEKTDTSYEIPSEVMNIDEYAFAYNPYLTEITWNPTEGYIYSKAFKGCTGITSVTLSENIYFIAEEAFNCENLKTVYCYIDSFADDPSIFNDGVKFIYIDASGDLSGDGSADDKDAALVMKTLSELISSGDVDIKQADVNHDGSIDILDAIQILKGSE
ncbi:MAG: leucine-rich repeat protein [Clostridiales bacterium]|nr:leucine-rich repeat protein [Clostridiales bacterium]